jgi:hypothetical protein
MKSMFLASNTNSVLNLKFCFMKNKLKKNKRQLGCYDMSTGKHLITFQMIIIMPVLDHEDDIQCVHNI